MATKRIADLLGIGYLIPEIELVKLVFPDGNEKIGTLMSAVNGIAPKKMLYAEKQKITPKFQRDCNSLNVLDAICHERDHRPGNYFVRLNSNGEVDSLEAFDNDAPMTFSLSAIMNILVTGAKETGAPVYVYRFVNLMGHSRPKYNSAISTFCWAVANDEEFTVNDRSTELEVLYIDDLVEGMFDLLEGKEQHCEFDGVETVLSENGRYCCVSVTHKVTLGEIVDLLEEFKAQPVSLMMPKCPEGSFAKKLFSLYLTYLPADKFKYAMKMNCDDRGSFTELVHTVDCGQVSINISKPGITKGQHWHNSKWEQFIVVHGHGLIQERNINTGETVEFEVSGDKIEAIYMIPGWTHNIINLSETDDLVTVMTCNEIFDPGHPDTFFEPV